MSEDVLAAEKVPSARQAPRLSFSGHQTFPFRYAWLPKGIRELTRDDRVFLRDDAVVTLGVGKNMVESIRFWCSALGLAGWNGRKGLGRATPLGRALFADEGWDPYLEDPATLWLLHWQLVDSTGMASTWSLAFTRWARDVFTREELLGWLSTYAAQEGAKRVSLGSLRRDVDVFLRTYVPAAVDRRRALEDTFDCPLVELGMIREIDDGFFQFNRGPKLSLPIEIFSFALWKYWRAVSKEATLGFERLLYDPGAPGAAFKLGERDLVGLLERLPKWTGFQYDETAGLRTVMRTADWPTDELEYLRRHYEGRS